MIATTLIRFKSMIRLPAPRAVPDDAETVVMKYDRVLEAHS
jgi:hypothetical protein